MALTRRAVAIAPSYAFGHFVARRVPYDSGAFEEGLACFELALQLDPLSLRVMRGLAWTLSASGQFEEAERRARMAIDLAPDSVRAVLHDGADLPASSQGRRSAGRPCGKGHRGSPTPLARGLEGAILAAAGDRAGAARIIDQLESGEEWVDPVIYSRIYMELGDTEKALGIFAASRLKSGRHWRCMRPSSLVRADSIEPRVSGVDCAVKASRAAYYSPAVSCRNMCWSIRFRSSSSAARAPKMRSSVVTRRGVAQRLRENHGQQPQHTPQRIDQRHAHIGFGAHFLKRRGPAETAGRPWICKRRFRRSAPLSQGVP